MPWWTHLRWMHTCLVRLIESSRYFIHSNHIVWRAAAVITVVLLLLPPRICFVTGTLRWPTALNYTANRVHQPWMNVHSTAVSFTVYIYFFLNVCVCVCVCPRRNNNNNNNNGAAGAIIIPACAVETPSSSTLLHTYSSSSIYLALMRSTWRCTFLYIFFTQ